MKKKVGFITILFIIFIIIFVFTVKFRIIKIDNFKNEKEYILINKLKNINENYNFLKNSPESQLNYADLIAYKNPKDYDVIFSKKTNYYSRVMALPGDVFEIKDGEIYINDKQITINSVFFSRYRITMKDSCDFNNILQNKVLRVEKILTDKSCNIIASKEQIDSLLKLEGILNLRKIIVHQTDGYYEIFPNTASNLWNEDNFGPIFVPKQSMTIELNRKNYDLYKKIIDIYEDNILEQRMSRYYIDGVEITNYSFEKNYYFVINDDRTNINDSRKFGFIPEEEIYGKIIY